MGAAEAALTSNNNNHHHEDEVAAAAQPPLVLGLQPSALVDHVARVDWSLLNQIPGEHGGSIPVALEELECILREVKNHVLLSCPDDPSPLKTMAGGSVANTIRGLRSGFGISSGIIGACGDDEQGKLFVHNMTLNGVDLSRLRKKKGHTAQVCLPNTTKFDSRDPLLQCNLRSRDFSRWIIPMAYNTLDYWINSTVKISLQRLHCDIRSGYKI